MKTYIVAVSGGVDSVVLLDMLAKKGEHELVVAHFDHGIRPESDADARFVWALAQCYGLPCEVRREELGAGASEELARARRYAFLRDIAAKYGNANIVTAHHQDDVVETIAINLARGTGWRGLAVFGRSDVQRPLLEYRKKELYDYALAHGLEWVEDETNRQDVYLRNRLRRRLSVLPATARQELLRLAAAQKALRTEIETELTSYGSETSRYFFIMAPAATALEILRGQTHGQLTRPQLHRLLLAIKTARPHTRFEAGNGWVFAFDAHEFVAHSPKKMLQ